MFTKTKTTKGKIETLKFLEAMEELGLMPELQGIIHRHRTTLYDLVTKDEGHRQKHISMARHEAMAMVKREHPKMSLQALGTLFNRDHATVAHALKKMLRLQARVAGVAGMVCGEAPHGARCDGYRSELDGTSSDRDPTGMGLEGLDRAACH